jgi:hypothetical protein
MTRPRVLLSYSHLDDLQKLLSYPLRMKSQPSSMT